MLIKVLIAAGILFYMFLFWWFKPVRFTLPCCRRIYPEFGFVSDESDKEVIVYNAGIRSLTVQKGETHENP